MRYLWIKQLKVWLPLLILIPLWAGSFVVARLGEGALIHEVHERLVLALNAYKSYVNTVLEDQERNLTLFLAGAIKNRAAGSLVPRFGWNYLSRYVPEAVGCLAFDHHGQLMTHTGVPGHPPFEVTGVVPMNLTEAMITDPEADATGPSGRSYYDVFLPLVVSDKSSYGSATGTVVCRVTNILSQTLAQYRRELGLTGDVYLVSAKTRKMLTESRSFPDTIGRMTVDTEGVDRALAGIGDRAFYADPKGVPVMGAFLTLPQYGWILLAEMAEEEALTPLYRLRMVLGISVGVVSIAAGFVGWRYGRQLEEKERIANELRIARDIQRSILPHHFPPFPDRKEFELYGAAIPAREVGGDFFDFFFLDGDRLAIVIADVSGKGMPAALFMAVTRTMLRGAATQAANPEECLSRVNNLLCLDNDEAMFVTVFYAVLNTRTGEVHYCNAGHNPPYRLSRGEKAAKLGECGGMALGAMPDVVYKGGCIRLQPSDSLFLFTDGVTEAMDPRGTLYSDDRLERVLYHRQESPTEIVKLTVEAVHRHAAGEPQSDDITVLVVQYLGSAPN